VGATLVYSSYPDRYETTTGPDGRFSFPAVSANRGGILFIDAPNPGGRPPFDRFTVTRTVAPLAPGSNTEQLVDIPKPSAGANVLQIPAPLDPAPSRALLRGGGQLGDFPYVFNGCTNGFTQADLEFSKGPVVTIWEYDGKNLHGPVQGIFGKAQIFPDGSALAQVQFPKPGSYDVFLELTPFVFTAMVVWVKETAQVLTFPPPQSMEEVTIEVYGKDGKPAPANVELTFPTYSPDLDPYTAVTDAMSRVYLYCVTRSPNVPLPVVTVEVDDPVSGYFDRELELPASGSSVLLTLELTTKPKKTESSKSKE
jgi:hypothetical protein